MSAMLQRDEVFALRQFNNTIDTNPEQILFLNYDALFHKFTNSDRGDVGREMIRLLRNYMEYSVITPTILTDAN